MAKMRKKLSRKRARKYLLEVCKTSSGSVRRAANRKKLTKRARYRSVKGKTKYGACGGKSKKVLGQTVRQSKIVPRSYPSK